MGTSFSEQGDAILEILFLRPSAPLLRSIENLIDVRMTRLTMTEVQSRDPTFVESVEKMPLDWDRLRDCDDSYASILVDPNQEFKLNLD